MLKQKELTHLLNSLKYGSGNVIGQNDRYTVTKPKNNWDMNYELHDNKEDIVYLIDVEDVRQAYYDDYEGILYDDLINLETDSIKEIAWKTIDSYVEY